LAAAPSAGGGVRRGPAAAFTSAAPAPAPAALPPALLASARDLAARLEPYFAGGLAHVFAAEDTVDFTAPLVVIHAADAGDAESRLGALKMALDGAAVREMLQSERLAGRRYTAVYFEEGQRLLQNQHMRRYVADLFTAIRKRNGMAMLATNSTQALFEREGDVTKAGPIWQNARGKVLLAMSREAVEDVRGHGTMPGDVVQLLEGLRAVDHLALLEWDGRYEVVRMDVPAEEAGVYRTRGLRAAGPRQADRGESAGPVPGAQGPGGCRGRPGKQRQPGWLGGAPQARGPLQLLGDGGQEQIAWMHRRPVRHAEPRGPRASSATSPGSRGGRVYSGE